jgi:hypothetical protein
VKRCHQECSKFLSSREPQAPHVPNTVKEPFSVVIQRSAKHDEGPPWHKEILRRKLTSLREAAPLDDSRSNDNVYLMIKTLIC